MQASSLDQRIGGDTSWIRCIAIMTRPWLFLGVVAAGAVLAAACGSSASPSSASTPAPIQYVTPTPGASATAASSAVAGVGAPTANVTIVAHNTSFNLNNITVPAGATVHLKMTNNDAIIHNFAVFPSASDAGAQKNAFFTGPLFSGPGTTKDLTFTAPKAPGSYYFQCDVHPAQMNGTFTVK